MFAMFLNLDFFKERKMIALLANAGGTLAALSSDWTQNTPLQSITLYLFFAGTVAMGAGAAYFLLMRNNVDVAYRSTMVCRSRLRHCMFPLF